MGYLLAIIAIISLTTMFLDYRSGPIVEKELDGQAIAGQLVIWHSAASKTCANVVACPSGSVVDGTPRLSGIYTANPANGFGQHLYHSFTYTATGQPSGASQQILVSYYQAPMGSGLAMQSYGSAQGALKDLLHSTDVIYAGPYLFNKLTPRTVLFSDYHLIAPIQYTADTYQLPPGTAGVTIPTGAPYIATLVAPN